MACDTCGKTGKPIDNILEIYQTDEIKQICDDCARTVNKHLHKLQRMTGLIQRDLLRSFLRRLRGEAAAVRSIVEKNNG